MSITFNKSQLERVAKQAISAHNKAQVNYDATVAKYKRDYAIAHALEYRDRIRKLRDFLSTNIRKGGVIYREDARKAAGGINDIEYLFYRGDPESYEINKNVTAPKGWLAPAQLIETRALIAVLEAAEGDTITANELKLLGLKNLAPIFTAAAQDAASAKR